MTTDNNTFNDTPLHHQPIMHTKKEGEKKTQMSFPHCQPQYPTQHASYASRILHRTRKHDGRAHRKRERLSPLHPHGVLSRQQCRHGAGGHKQRHVLAPTRRLNEDAPAAEETAHADAVSAVDALPTLGVLA